MTREFEEWVDENAIWMPDSDAMMFDVWNSILKFTSKSRTCESCRYAIKRGFIDKICDNESGIAYDTVVKTTDGCNKWESKMKAQGELR